MVGTLGAFVAAPMAVDRELSVAYVELAAGPNLVPAIVLGICWSLTSIALTVGMAWMLDHFKAPWGKIRRRVVLVAGAMLLVGVIFTGSLFASGTMSSAIADTRGITSAAELPAFVIVWVGVAATIGGLLGLVLAALPIPTKNDRARLAAANVEHEPHVHA
ncbi:hypothetical protein [Agrococcus sp. KRD186]|uniref:hypothetical protein n=1 Tax=Agrococcus sp. KRD186 TaxID=2729730 RepID=UPI0019D2D4E1|nr:hypothetical protein [Agrococcus sp. KRD186]